MFRYRSLIFVFCLFFTSCQDKARNNVVPSNGGAVVSQEYPADKMYEIVVLSNDTGKLTKSYFALGRDIKYDVISQEIVFKTIGGESITIKSSVAIEEVE